MHAAAKDAAACGPQIGWIQPMPNSTQSGKDTPPHASADELSSSLMVTQVRDRVPVHEKAAWAAGNVADTLMTTSIGQLALPVYNMAFGLDPRLVTTAMAIPRFLGAFLDPVVGNISDNTRTRWGRRRPYIFFGGIMVTTLYWLTWCPSSSWSPSGIFTYFILMSILFYAFYSVYLIPDAALGFELTGDYNERTRIQGYRSFMGSIVGLGLPYFFLWSKSPLFGGNTVSGIRWVTGIAAIVMMLAIFSTVYFCKERASAQQQNKIGLMTAIKISLCNGPFMLVLAIIMLVIVACFLTNPIEIYVITYHVAHGDEKVGAQIYAITGMIYGVLGILAVPLVTWTATHIGKRNTMLLGEALAIIAFLSTLVFYNTHSWWWILVTKVIQNPGLSTVWILGFSMIADVCDVDELRCGLRREGMFGAMYNTLVTKFGIAAITFASGFCLAWTGYHSGVTPSTQVVNNLRLLYSVAPAIILALAFVLTLYYPLSEKRMHEVRAELEARKQQQTASEQQTG